MKLLIIMIFAFSIHAQTKSLQNGFTKMVDGLLTGSVPLIGIDGLHNRQQRGIKMYILDTRAQDEYVVSHIKDAVHVGYKNFDASKAIFINKDAVIVLYCSVGYRSEKIGERLLSLGYTHVYNLYGGIFHWFNSGYPVYDSNGHLAGKIHGFSKKWGKWLRRGEVVY